MTSSVLLIDDDPMFQAIMRRGLAGLGFEVISAMNSLDIPTAMEANPFVLLLDLDLDGEDGMSMVQDLISTYGRPVIVVTASSSPENAVKAVREGAHDFLPKPVDFTRLEVMLTSARRTWELQRKVTDLQTHRATRSAYLGLIGASDTMQSLYDIIASVARATCNVLITGESGSGKELVARGLHLASTRSNGPFVDVNCGAFPKDLIESELFGHEKGAFTGADTPRAGLFEQAKGGTLFLDEIGEMDLGLQSRLLRVLQERKLRRLGSENLINLDVRVVTATNRDLPQEVQDGRFREDLYYRLDVVNLAVPPLRDRREDIPLLLESFMDKFCQDMAQPKPQLDFKAKQFLLLYDWPGNVRQLRNLAERLVVLRAGSVVAMEDVAVALRQRVPTAPLPKVHCAILEAWMDKKFSLPNMETQTTGPGLPTESSAPVPMPVPSLGGVRPLAEVEKEAILGAFHAFEGNVTGAADALGISKATYYRRLKDYDIEVGG